MTAQARSSTCAARSACSPGLHPAQVRLGALLLEMGDADGAAAAYRRAVAIDADSVEARNGLGLALMEKGEAEEAVATFRALVDAHPEDGSARHNLGTSLLQRGDLDGAVARLPRAGPPRARQRRGALQPRPGAQAEGRLRRPPRASCARRSCSIHACPRPRSRSASCSGRRAARPRRSRPFRAAVARLARATPRRTTCWALVLKQRRRARWRARAVPRGHPAAPAVRRGPPRPGPAPGSRGATRPEPRRRLGRGGAAQPAEGGRPGRRVRAQRRPARARPGAIGDGRVGALPRGGAPRSRQRAGALPARRSPSRKSGRAREAARHFAEAHRLAPYLPAGPGRLSGARPASLAAGLVACAARRGPGRGAAAVLLRRTSRGEAGLDAVTVFGGQETNRTCWRRPAAARPSSTTTATAGSTCSW